MVPNEKMHLHPTAIVLKKGEKETEIAANCWLDHIFILSCFTNKCSGENFSGDGSDHNLMIAKNLFSSISQ
jgi:hypothetical protein